MVKLSRKKFVSMMAELTESIRAKQAEKEALLQRFFEEHCPFKIGEKVLILHPKVKEPMAIGYVRWINLMDDGTFHYHCFRADKRGRKLEKSKYHYPESVSYQEHILIAKFPEDDEE